MKRRQWTETDTAWFRALVQQQGGLNAVAETLGVKNKRVDAWSRRGVTVRWVVPVARVLNVDPALLSPEAFRDIAKPWPGSKLKPAVKTKPQPPVTEAGDHLLYIIAACLKITRNEGLKEDLRLIAHKHFPDQICDLPPGYKSHF